MNILLIGNSESVHTERFATEFIKRGHKVSILTSRESFNNLLRYPSQVQCIRYMEWLTILFNWILRNEHNQQMDSVPHKSQFLILLRHIYLILFINRVVKNVEFDSIFALNLSIGGLFTARIKRNIPKVCTTLGCDLRIYKFLTPAYFINHPSLKRSTFRRINYLITGDENTFRKILSDFGIDDFSKVIFMGHFGVQIEKFSPQKKDLQLKRKLFDVDADCILAICHRPPRSDLDYENILYAISEILKKHDNFVFSIISGAANTDYLKKIVERYEIGSNVRFINNVPYEKIHLYIAQGDIFIDPVNLKKTPSFARQGISGSILEAMSCSLIPVVSNRPSINWILPDEAKPFIFEDFETDLAGAIEKAIKEKDNKKIKDAMRKAVIEKANWSKNIDKIEKLLRGGKK